MQSTETPRFVSIHLPGPSRIEVIQVAHVITIDVRPEHGIATAKLSDGTQVRGTTHQMWPLLAAAGLQASDVEAPPTRLHTVDDAEEPDGYVDEDEEDYAALRANVDAEAADQNEAEEGEDRRCDAEFDLEFAHFQARTEARFEEEMRAEARAMMPQTA